MLNILYSIEIGRCMSCNFVNEYGRRKVDKKQMFLSHDNNIMVING